MIIKEHQVRFAKLFFLPLLCFFACGKEKDASLHSNNSVQKTESVAKFTVTSDSVILNPQKGLVFYKNQPFTGTSISYYSSGGVATTIDYSEGKKLGLYKKYFENGKHSFEANYEKGRKHGTSRSWWKNGKLRSESHFIGGVPNGEQMQWYKSGAKFKRQMLVDGKEEGIQRAWRENGKIYNNYEAKNGRIFGLKRSTLCYELDDENLRIKD